MSRLLSLGLLAAFFFSSTFILNRAMSLEGGHWIWSATLRYVWMIPLLILAIWLTGQRGVLQATVRLFRRHWLFWISAGTIGFGVFYAGIAFAASFAPGWVIATTWQLVIVASLVVLRAYGRRVPARGVIFTLLIFAGVILVNVEQAQTVAWTVALAGAVPVLISAFAYPAGLQLVWEAKRGGRGLIPPIDDAALDDSFARVLLLTLGSMPFWLVLTVVLAPPPPTSGQWINTLLVAIFSGIVATTLFMSARQLAQTPYELAGVDATTAAEVLFALLGEVVLLGGALPGPVAMGGIALTVVGLVLYLSAQGRVDLPAKPSLPTD